MKKIICIVLFFSLLFAATACGNSLGEQSTGRKTEVSENETAQSDAESDMEKEQATGIISVSYTHLDVYKRQTAERFTLIFSRRLLRREDSAVRNRIYKIFRFGRSSAECFERSLPPPTKIIF